MINIGPIYLIAEKVVNMFGIFFDTLTEIIKAEANVAYL